MPAARIRESASSIEVNPHLEAIGAEIDAAIAERARARQSYIVRSCASKRRYPDKKSALTHINFMRKRRRGNTVNRRAYGCDLCSGWHMTNDDHDDE